jgi:hypothetical protein
MFDLKFNQNDESICIIPPQQLKKGHNNRDNSYQQLTAMPQCALYYFHFDEECLF